ncbi:tyrosine-type recombinase/integrase [Niallia taxi]|uniref:tyrosine-type recombinase/integrase n=1 Tax=Niallia taxi TaxID=2499688 RepID=UPI00300842E5
MQTNAKVEELHSYDVYNDICTYLEEIAQSNKESTLVSYKGSIQEFFNLLFPDTDMKFLTLNDINSLTKAKLLHYRKYLKEDKGNSNNTINKKVNNIETLFKKAFDDPDKYEKVNKMNIFNFNRLQDDSESYDSLTFEESERLAELVFKTEKHQAKMKNLIIRTSVRTSYRFGELTKLTWNDFEDKGDYVLVHVEKNNEKRNKHKIMPITKKLFNEILTLKEENVPRWNGEQDIVFKLKKDAQVDMMSRLNKEAKFLGERKIKFHSFRSVGADWEYEDSKDMKRVMQQLNHSNMNTSYNHYMNKDKDFLSMPGVRMEQDIKLDFLDDMNIDQLKEFIRVSNSKVKSDIKKFYDNECRK